MDNLLFRTLLLDFYGSLLTDKQRKAYELHYFDDLSLNEIGEDMGISRQAAWDLVNRTEKLMLNYEEKLRLVKKSESISKIKELIASSALLDIDKIKIMELLAQAEGDE